jgi:hypothetical protein
MSKSNNEVVMIVPIAIIHALQLDDESVSKVYDIKRLTGNQYPCGNQYLFGIRGLTETLIDASDRAGYDEDSMLFPEEFDIWAGMVIDGMTTIREHGRKVRNAF